MAKFRAGEKARYVGLMAHNKGRECTILSSAWADLRKVRQTGEMLPPGYGYEVMWENGERNKYRIIEEALEPLTGTWDEIAELGWVPCEPERKPEKQNAR